MTTNEFEIIFLLGNWEDTKKGDIYSFLPGPNLVTIAFKEQGNGGFGCYDIVLNEKEELMFIGDKKYTITKFNLKSDLTEMVLVGDFGKVLHLIKQPINKEFYLFN